MIAKPIERYEAVEYIGDRHRHHMGAAIEKFRLAAVENYDDEMDDWLGVVQVGLPKARMIDGKTTLEVVRLCTTGKKNVCSFLYSRAARIAREMGYQKIITYILDDELGTSLKASGWYYDGKVKGRSWNTPSRPRIDKHPICDKQRWAKDLN
ncbi:hypothetical protein P7D93_18730 [Enterococcus raffinosus]|uniref:XF1762 family protein n=1 Tax=Enterococcus raffinosus TaxID=71452 RepID=UPI00288D1901|nr:XF1762 family protein [Enterococcus raffinosus]MDT2531898.1 hypothetical protein [Enterococcus raffinosus]